MKIVSSWGLRLLGAYLIIVGLTTILSLSFNGLPMLLACLAVAAGVCLLIGI